MSLRLTNRNNKSINYTLPAPIKGLNKRDSLAEMADTYALTMDNYVPSDTKVALRRGYKKYVETENPVLTLAAYDYQDQSQFFAVAGHRIINISSAQDVHVYDEVSLSEDSCRTAQYKNYLYFVNGMDIPKVYYIDGNGHEHIGDWDFSGVGLNPRSITNVSVSKQRLWFVEKGSLKVWYPEVAGNISGNLQMFDLSGVCRFGGYLVAVANWTQDGGQGIDDLTVFITSEGEALVYSGSDINNADDWKLRGSFKISRPIGYQCCVPYQGDIVVISEDGYIPLSGALPLDRANASQIAFSDTIRGLVLERTAQYAYLSGWQGLIYGRGGYGLFNVPLGADFEQHIINVNTGAWCRFTGIHAFCWQQYSRRLYFGDADGVYLFDEGYDDDGKEIKGVVEQAYTNLGTERLKKVQLLNPRTKSTSKFSLVIYTNMDMDERDIDYTEVIGSGGNSMWNEVYWSSAADANQAFWDTSESTVLRSQWIANSSTGYKAGLVFKTNTKGIAVEWYETGVCYEIGEGVL